MAWIKVKKHLDYSAQCPYCEMKGKHRFLGSCGSEVYNSLVNTYQCTNKLCGQKWHWKPHKSEGHYMDTMAKGKSGLSISSILKSLRTVYPKWAMPKNGKGNGIH